MIPIRVHTHISAPREAVFDLLADMSARPSWTDHFQKDFRLESPRSSGVGAAARYRLDAPLNRRWGESEVIEADRPRRVVEATRSGRLSGTRGEVVYELSPQGRSLTRVDMTVWTEGGTPRELVKDKLGARRWLRRQSKKALERLRTILEEHPDEPLDRVTVAGWEQSRGPRFGTGTRAARG
ncbi:MAG TPA: SRPBCC family protein [Thermoleophilaceae bacterium]|nr:SRPBCC family protein [Thermoleophilaceae bacterium]